MKNYHDYKKCIDACLVCAAICNHCASSCLREKDIKMMIPCIQYDMECAAICYAAAQLMSLGSDEAKDIGRVCAAICIKCSAECSKHDNAHCRACTAACRVCAEACETL
jgi:hypothetical protein